MTKQRRAQDRTAYYGVIPARYYIRYEMIYGAWCMYSSSLHYSSTLSILYALCCFVVLCMSCYVMLCVLRTFFYVSVCCVLCFLRANDQ